MDDRSNVFFLLIVENDRSAVALDAPITSNSLITLITNGISSQFSPSQFLSILTISRVFDSFCSLTIVFNACNSAGESRSFNIITIFLISEISL